jgi:hypothetical protein
MVGAEAIRVIPRIAANITVVAITTVICRRRFKPVHAVKSCCTIFSDPRGVLPLCVGVEMNDLA